jgi:hypothetical protein
MSWIKRNLYFFIGSILTLVLMGAAGWYLYTKWQLNGQLMQQLDQDYATLDELNKQKPHPGTEKINNIQIAKEQQQQLRTNALLKAQTYFKHIAPIPDDPKPTDQAFSSAISRMIDQLQHEATNASVALPAMYSFSFEAEKSKISFAAGSLGPLATQLGEVKTLCEILFASKVNSLDNIRRERVSTDDANGPQSDYLTDKSLTNELAVLTPYELKFRSFSAELGSVLSGFASSPYGVVLKTINVEPAPTTVEIPAVATPTPDTPRPVYVQPVQQRNAEAEAQMALQRRYGIGPSPGGIDRYGAGADSRFGDRYGANPVRPSPQPVYVAPQPVAAQPAPATGRGGLPTVLDERPLQITLTVVLVKLLPPK